MSHEFSASRVPTWSAEGLARGLAGAAQDQHREVFNAIAARDAEAAGQAARQHLLSAAGRLGVAVPTMQAVDKQYRGKERA